MNPETELDAGPLNVDLVPDQGGTGLIAQVRQAQQRAAAGQAPAGDTVEPAAADAAAVPPPTDGAGTPAGDSPEIPKPLDGEDLATYQKRLSDTQRALHEKAGQVKDVTQKLEQTEAELAQSQATVQQLEGRIQTLVADPSLQIMAEPTSNEAELEALREKALADYKAAPDDDAALRRLMDANERIADAKADHRDKVRQIRSENEVKRKTASSTLNHVITSWLSTEHKHIPPKLFWGFAHSVAQQMPAEVAGRPLAQQIAWQASEAVRLCEEALGPSTTAAVKAARTGQAIEKAADVVMAAGGGSAPRSAPARGGTVMVNGIPTAGQSDAPNMIEQMRQFTSRSGGARPPS